MTDKKAAALAEFNKTIAFAAIHQKHHPLIEHAETIRALLRPTITEGHTTDEVGEAISELQYFMEESKTDSDDYYADVRGHIETLINAANMCGPTDKSFGYVYHKTSGRKYRVEIPQRPYHSGGRMSRHYPKQDHTDMRVAEEIVEKYFIGKDLKFVKSVLHWINENLEDRKVIK